MWSDNETSLDLVNVQHLVSAVSDIALTPHLQPVTVGVFGPWGSGKSSVMKMVREEVEATDGIVCVPFNGWLFEGYEDAKAALMGTILDELEDNLTLKGKTLDLAKHLRKRIDWLRLMGMAGKNLLSFTLTGMPSPDTVGQAAVTVAEHAKSLDIDEVKKLVKESPEEDSNPRKTVREFRDDFARLLEHSNVKSLIVLIDDLDRCLPDTVIETLEAIRLFLFVPRTAFVIGADEYLVQHAVKMRFPEVKGSQYDVGRDYLEKLVQVPVRVPPLGRAEVETYINLLFAERRLEKDAFEVLSRKLLARTPETVFDVGFSLQTAEDLLGEVSDELRDDLTLAQQVSGVLTNVLKGNPRQVKRFLNTLLLRLSMAESRNVPLKRRVLAKLMLLEEFRPEAFRTLGEWQAEADGRPPEIQELEAYLQSSNPDEAPDPDDPDDSPAVVVGRSAAWLDAGWIESWLSMEPRLAGEDLGTYFYFARDSVTLTTAGGQRLSRPAKEVLDLYLSPSEAYRRSAKKRAAELSEADAVTVFQGLADRTRRHEDLGVSSSPLFALLDLVETRPFLLSEALSFLGRTSASRLPVKVVPALNRITSKTPFESSATDLMRRWATASEGALATLAERQLSKKRAANSRSS
ncbi:MAG: P-loop NTPase fold protein [Bacteroidota bacterium]